jgi:hypothetical protein
MGYSEACGSQQASFVLPAVGGINLEAIVGALKEVFFTIDGAHFDSPSAAKILGNWNSIVLAEEGVFIGDGKFANEGEDETRFQESDYNVDIITSKGTKALRFTQVKCSLVHAELLSRLNGAVGRVFFRTSQGFLLGREEPDTGDIKGYQVQLQFGFRDFPTSENPIFVTDILITFQEPESDEQNPAEIKLPFPLSDVIQPYLLVGKSSAESSNGTTLTATLQIDENSGAGFEGLAAGDLAAEDENGNALVIASLTDNGAGSYTIEITTALTKALVKTDGIFDDTAGTGRYWKMHNTLIEVSA